MTSVFVISDTPDHERRIQVGQPPTTMGAWRVDVEDGQEPLDAVKDFLAAHSAQLPIGAEVCIVGCDHATTYRMAPALEEVVPPDYNAETIEALQAMVDERGLTVEGTGANGNVLKADLIGALEADDAQT